MTSGHEQNFRLLDQTKIGMTEDVIDQIARASMSQSGLPFPKLAEKQPFDAYNLVRGAYESQPHEKPVMPEVGQLSKLDVFSVTRYTGLRGLIRAVRALPTETASHYATIVFDNGDDGTPKSVPNAHNHNAVVLPFRASHEQSNTERSEAA